MCVRARVRGCVVGQQGGRQGGLSVRSSGTPEAKSRNHSLSLRRKGTRFDSANVTLPVGSLWAGDPIGLRTCPIIRKFGRCSFGRSAQLLTDGSAGARQACHSLQARTHSDDCARAHPSRNRTHAHARMDTRTHVCHTTARAQAHAHIRTIETHTPRIHAPMHARMHANPHRARRRVCA